MGSILGTGHSLWAGTVTSLQPGDRSEGRAGEPEDLDQTSQPGHQPLRSRAAEVLDDTVKALINACMNVCEGG